MRETDGLMSLFDRGKELMASATARTEEPSPPGPESAPERDDQDDVWSRVTEASTVAPVHGDPTLEPADSPWEVAMMAGWGDPEQRGRGHDALGGVDDLILGKKDARDELSVSEEGEPDPLELTAAEDLDEKIRIDVGLDVENENDWTSHL